MSLCGGGCIIGSASAAGGACAAPCGPPFAISGTGVGSMLQFFSSAGNCTSMIRADIALHFGRVIGTNSCEPPTSLMPFSVSSS